MSTTVQVHTDVVNTKRPHERITPVNRLTRIALQVGNPTPSRDVSVAEAARAKSFIRGVLAHLLIVPLWVIPPGALISSLVVAGAPFGIAGIASMLGLGTALLGGPKKRIPALSAVLMALAVATRRKRAAIAGGIAAFMALLTNRTKPISALPWVFNYVDRWAKDFYAQTALRGALSDIRPTKSFFGFHPHGCLCAGWTINGTYNADFMRAAGRMAWLCDDKLRHKNPGFQLMSEAYQGEDRAIEACDAQGFKGQMSQGVNVAFLPGGFQDAVAFEYGKDVCVLRSRKGFIKYCLQFGYRVHPVYTFGECETFHTFTGLKSLRTKIARQNVPALAFFGWPLFPCLPRPASKILTYVGPGIDFPHIAKPSNEEVDHWHQVYMDALLVVFNNNKAEAGYPSAELEIL